MVVVLVKTSVRARRDAAEGENGVENERAQEGLKGREKPKSNNRG